MSSFDSPARTPDEEKRIRAAEFAWDLAIQMAALREARGLSQAELAEHVGTKQQAISRMESPTYDRQNLAKLREVAEAMGAFVDVVIVPAEKADAYLDYRYQPALEDEPPYQWVQLSSDAGGAGAASGEARQQTGQRYRQVPWKEARAVLDQAISGSVEPAQPRPGKAIA
jgi:transcriptional regulator with XRE-family HTH domain